MAITPATVEGDIASELYNEIVSFINGTTPTSGIGSPGNFVRFNSAAAYAVVAGQVDTTNGLAFKAQYGNPDGAPTTLMTVAKAAIDHRVTATFAATGKAIGALAGTLPLYYAGQGSDYARFAVSDGTSGVPSSSADPAVRAYRVSTPNFADGVYPVPHIYANYDFGSEVVGVITGTGGYGGRFHQYNFSSYITGAATGTAYSIFGGIFHAVANTSSAAANGLLVLAQTGTQGGQVVELDQLNYFGGAIPPLATTAVNPSATGTAGLNILGQATGVNQVDTITITGASGGTFTITVSATTAEGVVVGGTTAGIAFGATAAAVATTIAAIPSLPVGSMDVTGTGAPGTPYTIPWANYLEHTAITTTGSGAGLTGSAPVLTVATPTPGSFAGRFNDIAIMLQSSGKTQSWNSGYRPMPWSIRDGGYAVDLIGVAGNFSGVTAAARTVRVPNNVAAIYARNAANSADIGLMLLNGSDQLELRNASAIRLTDAGGTPYAQFTALAGGIITGVVQSASGTATTGGGAQTLKLGASGPNVYCGSGVPSVSAVKGSLYLRTDGASTTTRAYINTDGGTTWTAITTVA